MIARRVLILLVVLAVATGCRLRRDPSVDLLEAEIRWLEDQLYTMEDDLSLQQSQLESCRRENAALRKELGGEGSGTAPGSGTQPPARGTPSLPRIEMPDTPSRPEIDFGTPTLPEIDFGTPTEPEIDLGEPLPGGPQGELRESRKPSAAAPAADTRDGHAATGSTAAPAADREGGPVDRIILNRQLTGGKNFDGVAGDDGILVVVEPQDAAGQYAAVPAPVSVVVLDPAKSGQSAYVARWNFDVVDTTARLRETLLGRGIYLDLPWPGAAPEHNRLNLYVRYVTVDGRKLDVQKSLQIDLTGDAPSPRQSTHDAATRDRSPAAPATAANPQSPRTQNPLRPNPDGAAEQDADSKGPSQPLESTASLLPPNHDPNEPPPLWNGGQTSGQAGQRSVVVRRDEARDGQVRRDEQTEQALRPRPWTPHR